MNNDNPNTIRNRLFKICGLFEKIDVALFSTFNFNGDFFEENVLPALFVIDEDTNRAVRSREVHKALAKTSVGVFYDPSVAKPSGKDYRYTHYPIFISGSLFHAKNVFLIGTINNTRWIYVATLSANLTLSGWGANCEVMADTWIHSSSEQPWIAVDHYFNWLKKQLKISEKVESSLSTALKLISDPTYKRRTLADPEQGTLTEKKSVRLYFSPVHKSFWSFVCENVNEISSIEIASPYWGSVCRCIALLGDEVAFAKGLDISLVMGHLPPTMHKTGLGKDDFNELNNQWQQIEYSLWKNEEGRFHHLKLYRLETDKGTVSAAGSCNFSYPGLLWNLSANVFGNVESMMLNLHKGIKWSTEKAINNDFGEESTADDAPAPWPFYITVSYDWKSSEYTWSLKGNLGSQQACLRLSGYEISIDKTSSKGKQGGKLMNSLYTVKSEQFGEMIGCVIELNLDYSTREYSTPLATEMILQSWLQGGVNEPIPKDDGDGDGDGDDSPTAKKETTMFFEFFDFYRATAGFEAKLIACVTDDETLDLLLWRSDSVVSLGLAIIASTQSSTTKYLVLNECIRLMKLKTKAPELEKDSKKKLTLYIKKLNSKVSKYRADIMKELSQELNKDMDIDADAAKLLGWYESKLRRAVL